MYDPTSEPREDRPTMQSPENCCGMRRPSFVELLKLHARVLRLRSHELEKMADEYRPTSEEADAFLYALLRRECDRMSPGI